MPLAEVHVDLLFFRSDAIHHLTRQPLAGLSTRNPVSRTGIFLSITKLNHLLFIQSIVNRDDAKHRLQPFPSRIPFAHFDGHSITIAGLESDNYKSL